MSYLQIEIGGKLRGLKFNQLAIEILSTFNDTNTSSAFMYAMVYGGLRGNSYVKREEPDYTFENVCDWCDVLENKDDTILLISQTLTETQIWKTLVAVGEKNVADEDEKKKA
jgi:hypothetical protein